VADLFNRILQALAGRMTGPLWLSMIFQPTTGLVLALVDGIGDARAGWPPFLWSLFAPDDFPVRRLPHGWSDVIKVLLVALLVDMVYQYLEVDLIFAGEALLVAFALAVIPYVVLRGLVTRIARWPRLSAGSPPGSWPPG
jgi:hypothetical protein